MTEQPLMAPEGLAPMSGEEDDEEKTKEGYVKTTVGELGPTLPMGVVVGNPPQLERHFDTKDYYWEEEQELNKIRNKKEGPGQHPGKTVTEVLNFMLTSWGGKKDFQTTNTKNRRQAVDSAFMTDVLFAYVYLRIQALGSIYTTEVNCAACGHDWTWRTDLNGAEVTVPEKPQDLDKEYKLIKQVKFGDKVYDTVHLRPPPWSAVSHHPMGRSNAGQVKSNLMMAAVRGLSNSKDRKQRAIGMSTHVKLTKLDYEMLVMFVDRQFPSVDLNFQIECESCGAEFLHMMQWNFDFFFSGSSLPQAKSS